MINNTDLTTARWTSLLTSYFDENEPLKEGLGHVVNKNNERFIEINCSLLDQAQILEITKVNAIKGEFTLSNLTRISSLFDSVIEIQTTLLEHSSNQLLHCYSARFSKWAQNHTILAGLVCILSFGILYAMWCDGKKIHNKASETKRSLEHLTSCSAIIKQELKLPLINQKKEEPSQSFQDQFQLIMETHLNQITENLYPLIFQEELAEIENLQTYYANYPAPKSKKEVEELEHSYLSKCVEILQLLDQRNNKKYRSIKDKPFFKFLSLLVHPHLYASLPDELRKDKEICLELVKRGKPIDEIDRSLQEDREINLLSKTLSIVPDLRNDKAFFLEALESIKDPISIPEALINDREVILKVMRKNGLSLQFIDEHKRDPEVILAALEQNGEAFCHLPEDLKTNREYILKAARTYAPYLKTVSKEFLETNQDEIIKLLPINGMILEYCSEQIRNDPIHVSKAVQQVGPALQFASPKLKSTRAIVIEAIKQNPLAIQFAKGFWADEEICKMCILSGKPVFQAFTPKVENKKDLILLAIKNNRENFKYISEDLKKDRDTVLAGLKNDSYLVDGALRYHAEDQEIILEAIYLSTRHFYFASSKLKEDLQFVKKILLQYKREGSFLYRYLADLKSNPDIVELVLTLDGLALEHVPDSFKADKKYALIAVRQNDLAYHYVPKPLNEDPDIQAAINTKPRKKFVGIIQHIDQGKVNNANVKFHQLGERHMQEEILDF